MFNNQKKKYNISIIIIVLLIFFSGLTGQDNYKWKKLAGKWEVRTEDGKSFLIEKKRRASQWNYNELINFNSILSNESFTTISSIAFSIKPSNPKNDDTAFMASFGITDGREFFAFKLSGDDDELDKVQFVWSKIKDKTLSIKKKANFVISEVACAEVELDFDKEYNVKIDINSKKAAISIDGKKALEGTLDRDLASGKIAFSSRNFQLQIDDVKVFNGKKIIFEDDFSKDSIKRKSFKGTVTKKKKGE